MAWDSTGNLRFVDLEAFFSHSGVLVGQEGVYAWSTYFNGTATATNALNSIIAYEPTVPHWYVTGVRLDSPYSVMFIFANRGYAGNARRYWYV